MASLNRLASNWSRTEREKLNTNWSIIENYLSNLQEQINFLTNGVNVQELIDQINDILNQGNVIIADLEAALQDATTVITNAENATTDANNAAQDALNAVNDMQVFINQFGNAETYDNSKLYKVNNIVEFDGSGFICVQDSQGNTPPTLPIKRNEWWQLFAQKGTDGTGAVSKVAGKSPEVDGNVPLTAQDVGAVSITDFNGYLVDSAKIFINAANPPAPLIAMKFDEQTDDTVALQNIINYLETKGGGSILFPQGISLISSKIVINKPIYLIGQGKGGNSDNTNGSGIGNTTFRWSTLQSGTMFEFVSETPSSTLFDGGMSNILLDGGSTATRGFKCKSCGYMDFKSIEGRSFVSELGLIDDSNGVLSQFNRFEDIKYVYGAGVDTQNSHGLVFYGVSEIGVTQNHIISITGLMHSGYLLVFKTSDNNVVEKCHSATIGTGGSIWFANGIYSDSHLINYLVGRVKSDSMAKGNRIVHWNSEGGGLDITEGSIIHYEVYDYYQCNLFTTKKYIMTDQKSLTIGDFDIVDGGAIKGIAANQWSCINLPDNATDSRISCIVPPECEWYDGTINTLRIRFSQDSQNSGGRFRITVKASTSSNNGGVHLLEYDASTLVPANTFPYTNQHIDIPINLEYKKDDLILISITRNGSHTEDTAIGNMQIIGAQLIYNSVGPNSSGSGSYPNR